MDKDKMIKILQDFINKNTLPFSKYTVKDYWTENTVFDVIYHIIMIDFSGKEIIGRVYESQLRKSGYKF